jgi:hypothetical protein
MLPASVYHGYYLEDPEKNPRYLYISPRLCALFFYVVEKKAANVKLPFESGRTRKLTRLKASIDVNPSMWI